ncbi:hypothetical protein [Bradyrhizobium sp. 195]|uniref:hypothetical protein n=1 Tax=Bradyrhizobium sp. 195 TaxID=2782662 RepID=UPI00200143A4|nr:hypothetical protein [Bradyrhizobium sp. 195]UPK30818.1 hypothetical protein IVB26_20130 [Bradyrhizobium sp. 195]
MQNVLHLPAAMRPRVSERYSVRRRTVPHVSSVMSGAAMESDMDACWFLAEIAKVFWCDRHPRLRKGKPSVPQVPPGSTSPDASSPDKS